jgi:hypothetical protein
MLAHTLQVRCMNVWASTSDAVGIANVSRGSMTRWQQKTAGAGSGSRNQTGTAHTTGFQLLLLHNVHNSATHIVQACMHTHTYIHIHARTPIPPYEAYVPSFLRLWSSCTTCLCCSHMIRPSWRRLWLQVLLYCCQCLVLGPLQLLMLPDHGSQAASYA